MDHEPFWAVLLEIRDSQARTELDLKYHIMRTDTLEGYVKEQEERLSKVEDTKQGWIFTGKVLAAAGGILVTTIGLVATILGMLK